MPQKVLETARREGIEVSGIDLFFFGGGGDEQHRHRRQAPPPRLESDWITAGPRSLRQTRDPPYKSD